jgi:phage-related tail fiber protein
MAQKRFLATNGLDANSKTITNVSDPVNAQDAVSKAFSINATNLSSGTLDAARLPAITGGDVSSSVGSAVLTLALSGVTAGTYGSGNQIPTLTVDSKGRITSASNTAISTTVTLSGDLSGTGDTGTSITTTLADTAVTTGNYGSATAVATFTVDSKGRITAASNTAIALAATAITSGTLPAARMPALTGDITTVAGAVATTLAASGVTAGTYKSVTVNAKGLVTGGTNPTTISGYGITDAYTKTEIDTLVQGLDPKGSVVAATTANITLSAPQTIDTIAVVAGDRVLVKNQTLPAENGIYLVAAGAWTRSTDMSVWSEVPSAYVFVEKGSQADNGFLCTSDAGGTLGTTAITFVQFSGAGQITAGTGLTKSGNTLSITNTAVTATSYGSASSVATFTVNAQGQLTAAASTAIAIASSAVSGLAASATTDTTNATNIGSGTLAAARLPAFTGDATSSAGSSALTLATVATAGTYKSVTINAKGLVTSGTNPTTLAGYGITDALSTATNTNVPLTHGEIATATLVTSATTANQVLSSEAVATYRAASYKVQITSGTAYHMVTIDVMHDGTTAYITTYGEMYTGAPLATFDADINAGNLRLLTSPANATTTFKLIKTLIDI